MISSHRQLIHYTDHPAVPTKNNKAHLVDFGVEGEIAPKLTGQIQTGLQYRKYDDAQTLIGGGNSGRITRNWMVATTLNYRPIERTKITGTLSRSLQEATFGNNAFYIATAAGLNVTHQLPWKLAAGANLDYTIQEWPKAGASYVYRTRFSHGLSEQFNYRDHLTGVTIGATF